MQDIPELLKLANTDPIAAYASVYGSGWAERLRALPEHMHSGVVRWVLFGIEGGSFMRAVFGDQLVRSFMAADDTNQRHMMRWVEFLVDGCPHACRGEGYQDWKAAGGMYGLMKGSHEQNPAKN